MKKYALQLMSLLMVGALLVGCTAATGDGAQTTVTTSAPTTTTTTVTTTAVAPTTTTENTTVTTEGTTTTTKVETVTTTPQMRVKNLMETVSAKETSGKPVDETFYKAYTQFALEFFKKANAEDDDNALVSPLSVELMLAMLANGTNGATKQEIEKALGLSTADLNGYLRNYMVGLPNRDSAFTRIANSIWIENGYTVKKPFLQTNADYYGAEIYQTKFDGKALEEINNWVSKNTDGMIPEILEEFPPNAVMALINTVLFDAEWKNGYRGSTENVFTTEDGQTRKVQFLNTTEEVAYIETEYETGFAKQYNNGYYSFVALLPTEGTALDDYINGLTTKRVRGFWNTAYTRVKTSIPAFEIEYEADMKSILKSLGMKTLLSDAADLSGIGNNLLVGEVKHKTAIVLDKSGTKAAAVSATVNTMKGASENPPVVTLDRPFVYMIVDNTTGLPLFIGSVTDIGK